MNIFIMYIDYDTSLTYEFAANKKESIKKIQNYDKFYFNSIENLYGMFLIPNLLNKSQIICDADKNNQYKKLNVGESMSIPLLCEYFINPDEQKKDIYKTIAFSLQTSLTKDIDNYILKVNVSNKLKHTSQQSEIYIPLISSDIFD